MKNEKFILSDRVHLSYLGDTFQKGTVFEVNRDKGEVKVDDGRVFKELRDIDICIRNGYLISYSKENEKELIQEKAIDDVKKNKPIDETDIKKQKKMQIIESDEDLMDREIELKWRKTKEIAQERKKGEELEVIRERKAEVIRGVEVVRDEKVTDIDNNDKTVNALTENNKKEEIIRGVQVIRDNDNKDTKNNKKRTSTVKNKKSKSESKTNTSISKKKSPSTKKNDNKKSKSRKG